MHLVVLINADKTSVLDIVNEIEKIPAVLEVFPTFGRFDIVAFFSVNNLSEVKSLLNKISSLKGVIRMEELLEI
ncbi:MAG: Lrp/AsnC family transcriptional regulator [Candidatus Methanomethylicota archaeon]|jgi:DNA-binding Lrp family transcriptional regulator|uniref:Lrp/AsnC family transcriptional regulator n=1 Tax=Thermoproteota archaeon TaxID=2056631 RepID=A0A520KE76_9CREN|nr:MAG: Lrp/AsnC family transcriptional regulator [Candidatus Verstraetearchaeota archaeon]TDA38921.1 MAG: Lrp/AsnC family transcriptional regulator [Candidatus Verstraetearchaeota archaeon]